MYNYKVSGLYVYPVKSLGGISLASGELCETGLLHDRRWMLIDNNGVFLSQRTVPALALLQVALFSDHLMVTHKHDIHTPLYIPLTTKADTHIPVSIWDDVCPAIVVADAGAWFSEVLQMQVRLVYMPDSAKRLVDPEFAANGEVVSFADAYPFLLVGQSSLIDLNSRLPIPVPMDRFRPNIVFTGGEPYVEDTFQQFKIGDTQFHCVEPCARCVLTTINQQTAAKGKEPLKTLATYRTVNNKVLFGQNVVHSGTGRLSIGDKLYV